MRNFKELQHLLRLIEKLFKLVIRGFRFDEFDELNFIELMLPDQAASISSSRTRFFSKARGIRRMIQRQHGVLHDLVEI